MTTEPVTDRPRRLVIALALLAVALAWICMAGFARALPWYRQVDPSPPVLTNALALNTGILPAGIAEPGLASSFLLALDWRARHRLGSTAAWNIPAMGESQEPLGEIRSLVHLGRSQSRLLVILLIVCGGALACAVVPGVESGALAIALLCGSAGLLYQGLGVRPELLGCGLGGIGLLLGVWWGTAAPTWWKHHLGLFLAGVCGGFAALAQPSGIFHLFVGGAWCWLAALTTPGLRRERIGLNAGLLPLASAVVLLALAHQAFVLGATTAVTAERLRGLALLAGLLPLAALWRDAGRTGAFLRERACEFALLAGGAMAALVLTYAGLRTMLPTEAAAVGWAGQLELFFYPGLFLENVLAAPPGVGRAVISLVRETPFLFAAAAALAVMAGLQRAVPARLKAFIGLLLAGALVQTWQLAHVRHLESASVGVEVALLLVCAISLLALGPWPHRSGRNPWLAPLIITGAAVLLATMPIRLRVKSAPAVTAANAADSGQTLQNLFDHPAHPPAYRQMMQDHYGDRGGFERAFRGYLTVPEHRY